MVEFNKRQLSFHGKLMSFNSDVKEQVTLLS